MFGVKMKTGILNNDVLARAIQKSTCMDCIFWYQCRQGNIDCSLKPKPKAVKAVSF
jgi:hypothetical protein